MRVLPENIYIVEQKSEKPGCVFLFLNDFVAKSTPHHIYVVSNKKIKEKDYYYSPIHKMAFMCLSKKQYLSEDCKRLEYSTDTNLTDLTKFKLLTSVQITKCIKLFNTLKKPTIHVLLNMLFENPEFTYVKVGGSLDGPQLVVISKILNDTMKEDFLLFDNLGGKAFDIMVDGNLRNSTERFKDFLLKDRKHLILAYKIKGVEFISDQFKDKVLNFKGGQVNSINVFKQTK